MRHVRTFRNVLQPKVGVARTRGLPCASRCARDVLPLPVQRSHGDETKQWGRGGYQTGRGGGGGSTAMCLSCR